MLEQRSSRHVVAPWSSLSRMNVNAITKGERRASFCLSFPLITSLLPTRRRRTKKTEKEERKDGSREKGRSPGKKREGGFGSSGVWSHEWRGKVGTLLREYICSKRANLCYSSLRDKSDKNRIRYIDWTRKSR